MGTLGRSIRNGKKAPSRRVEARERAHPAIGKLAVALKDYKEAVEQQAATAEILRAISKSPGDAQPVFEAIVQKAHRLCDAAYSVLYRYDGKVLEFVAARGVNEKVVRLVRSRYPQQPDRDKIVGRAVLEGRTFHTADITNDNRFPASSTVVPRRAVVAVPLVRNGVVLGAISCGRAEARAFTKKEISLLNTFADQAVIAIENTRLFNETKESLEHQKASADILRIVAGSVENTDPVFEAITQAGMRLVPGCRVGLLIVENGRLHHASYSGASIEHAAIAAKQFPAPIDRTTVAGASILDRRVIHVRDIRDHAHPYVETRKVCRELGDRAFLCVPLLRDGQAVGSISLRRPIPGAFTEKQIELVKTFADQAVIALQNAKMFREIRERNAELKQSLDFQGASGEILSSISSSVTDTKPVFDAIAENTRRLLDTTYAAVSLVREDRLELAAAAGDDRYVRQLRAEYPWQLHGEDGVFARRAVRGGKVVHVCPILGDPEAPPKTKRLAQAAGYDSILIVPMLREGVAIGVIIAARQQAVPFDDKQIALIKAFADQAVIAIENVRLFNETKEALERQTATAEILKVISSSPTDTQPVFDAILERAIKLCDAETGILFRYLDGAFHALAKRIHDPAFAELFKKPRRPAPGAKTGLGRLMRERRAVHIPDITKDEAYVERDPLRLETVAGGMRAWLGAPMLKEGDLVGAIVVYRTEPRPFSEQQVSLLQTFADQAVIAIENARLFNETKEALERQTATGEILRVIAGTPADAQPVFDAIAQSALRLFGVSHVAIMLRDGDSIRSKATAGSGDPRGEFVIPLNRDSTAGRCMLDRTVISIGDTEAADAPSFARDSGRVVGFRAIAAAPMLREGVAIGSVHMMRKASGPFSDAQIVLLRTFADQAVIAIENARLFNETKESLEKQTATAEILRVISSSPTDTQPVFEAIVRNATRLCEAVYANVFRYDGELIHWQASHGWPSDLLTELKNNFPMRPNPTRVAGRVVLSGQAVQLEDTRADPEYDQPLAHALRYRKILGVPLLREANVLGALTVGWSEPGVIEQRHEDLLKTFADQAVIAIENVRLFKELQERNRALTEALEQQTATGDILKVISRSTTDVQPVFETIIRNAVRLCAGAFGMLFTFDGKMLDIGAEYNNTADVLDMFRREYPQPVDRATPSGRAIVDSSVINIPDVLVSDYSQSVKDRARASGWRGGLTVPLTRDNAAIGAIAVVRREPGAFSDSYVALLQTFADQAVIAIENVRLFNETKEALEQQTAISEVLRVISSSPTDVKPVLEAVCMRAARICDASDARIFLAEGKSLRHAAGFGDVPVRTDVIPLSGTVGGHAILDGAPIHIEDIQAESGREYPIARQFATEAGWRTILTVPLIREKTALGTISLRRRDVRAFTEKQITLLKTFADQAAIAIENVRLFNETKEALEQQKASADVLGAISSSIADTTPVFDKILESCQRLFAGRNVGINVVGDDGKVHIGAYKGFGRAELEAHFPVPLSMESGSGAAIVQRQVVHYPDCEAPDVPEYARRGGKIAGNRSVLFAPMLWEGRGIGAIFVGRPVVGPYSDKEIALLRTFADQAAIAIQNAHLFREIQEKSAQLEVANKHKSDFLANMSHELRTPLNAIIGFSEALMERMFGELNDKQGDYLKDIHESGKHLLSLINDILDLSKIEAGRMDLEVSSFHLPTALSNAMTLIRERAQRHAIELGLDVDERLGEFQADERKFKQIMLNLLSNAVKFTPDGGRVDVCAKKDTDKIEIAIKDTGIGIAPEDQAAVFEEFKQVGRDQMRKAEGTGLGLALTRRFVELHGGAIRLESTPGKGSTFTVSLPIRI